jgi:hypothetical protein
MLVCPRRIELHVVVLDKEIPQPYLPMVVGPVDIANGQCLVLKQVSVGNNQCLSGEVRHLHHS